MTSLVRGTDLSKGDYYRISTMQINRQSNTIDFSLNQSQFDRINTEYTKQASDAGLIAATVAKQLPINQFVAIQYIEGR